jgi:magnesium-transporting ATPase (P-type)
MVAAAAGDGGSGGGGWLCFTVEEEVEVEWRTVALRFGVDTAPAPGQRGSISNAVFTAKYTALSFLPKGIFEQFRRVANVYFLGISVLMAVGTYVPGTWFSSLDPWTTIGPLALIVGLTLTKEGLEDGKRHKADRAVNTRTAEVLCADGSFQAVGWASLQPGMVLRIADRGEFPADLVPLASSEDAGKCYIETANIDGETNLKLRR